MAVAKLGLERPASPGLQLQFLVGQKCKQSVQDDGSNGEADGRRSAEDLLHRVCFADPRSLKDYPPA